MSIRSASLAGKPSPHTLNVKFTQLSIRTLNRKRVNAPPILDRVRDEFAEMRGFSPTLPQAARLFDLSLEDCDRVLSALLRDGSLKVGADGRYRLR
jgi:hypothetical protein